MREPIRPNLCAYVRCIIHSGHSGTQVPSGMGCGWQLHTAVCGTCQLCPISFSCCTHLDLFIWGATDGHAQMCDGCQLCPILIIQSLELYNPLYTVKRAFGRSQPQSIYPTWLGGPSGALDSIQHIYPTWWDHCFMEDMLRVQILHSGLRIMPLHDVLSYYLRCVM